MSVNRCSKIRLECKVGGCWDYRNFPLHEVESGVCGQGDSPDFVHNFFVPMARILLRRNGSGLHDTTSTDGDGDVLAKERQIPRALIGE